MKEPSSHVNNKSVFFGLSFSDVSSLGAMLSILLFLNKEIFKNLNFSYWALSMTVFAAFLLIPIRIKYRRKIIRDSIKFFLKKRILHAPKHH
ncbi:MAG TPA: hypothetical protein PLJ21_00990 [Pseudobdellovibrionaceae bacterium]|nr:hypothetical protein [Pseudobdellovibrionaceae bacterium]